MSTSFKNRPFAVLSKAGQSVVWQVFLQPGKHKAVLFKRSDAAMMNAMGSPMNSAFFLQLFWKEFWPWAMPLQSWGGFLERCSFCSCSQLGRKWKKVLRVIPSHLLKQHIAALCTCKGHGRSPVRCRQMQKDTESVQNVCSTVGEPNLRDLGEERVTGEEESLYGHPIAPIAPI